MIAIRPARAADIAPIAARMRPIDRLECRAFGHDPRTALRLSFQGACAAHTATADGAPVAMFGVGAGNLLDGVGHPWLLGAEEAACERRAWLTHAPRLLAELSRGFRRLENYVHCDNAAAIAWLSRLGFQIAREAEPIGGQPFLRFTRHVR